MMGITLFLFGVLSLSLCSFGVEGRAISEEEDAELERQLQLINKPPIKTFQTGYGDIIDCIDINKQPAFDHPLLKNHKIQMSPSHLSKKASSGTLSTFKTSRIGFKNKQCPLGTIPIRRTSKEDLLREKSPPKRGSFHNHSLVVQNPGQHFAILRMKKTNNKIYYGAKAHINIYNPDVEANQASSAQIWIEEGPLDDLNSIEVGWTVDPQLYGDTQTRLFTHWTADGYKKTGCYNTRCPGFIQVNNKVPLDYVFRSSTIDGDQFDTRVEIRKDQKTGDWWFIFTDQNVSMGYWPNSIFTHLKEGASQVSWGGKAVGPPNNSPTMGSGYLTDFTRGCFFRQLKVVDGSGALVDLDKNLSEEYTDAPSCYEIDYFGYYDDLMGQTFLFGGSGGGNCGN